LPYETSYTRRDREENAPDPPRPEGCPSTPGGAAHRPADGRPRRDDERAHDPIPPAADGRAGAHKTGRAARREAGDQSGAGRTGQRPGSGQTGTCHLENRDPCLQDHLRSEGQTGASARQYLVLSEGEFSQGPGSVNKVADALIAAQKARIQLTFETAAAIDLAGRDVLEAVKMSVNPKVIETPIISAVAKDGIEVKAKTKITVRANISRLIGGAGESTIIARVGEGIVTSVGSAESYKEVLENPDLISQTVLKKGLDAGTAFEILSIDIADVDIGRNIGAQLQTDQAEADKKIAQAKAEERRVMAVAREQEMKSNVQEMRAKVVEAEALVPKAMAKALEDGNLGVLDYYNMKNVIADTQMRESISEAGKSAKTLSDKKEK